jgi:hypothetical protein
VDPGSHAIVVVRGEREIGRASFDLTEGEHREIPVEVGGQDSQAEIAKPLIVAPPPPPEDSTSLLPYIVGGSGVAALAASGVLWLVQSGHQSQLAMDMGKQDAMGKFNFDYGTYESRLDGINRERILSGIIAGCGTVAIAVALLLALGSD